MITARTDVVGSLLRPPDLLKARQKVAAGKISGKELNIIEDGAVDAAISLQEQAGLEVVTDGEMRRLSFQSQMTEAVEGFSDYDLDAFLWGDWYGGESVGDLKLDRPKQLSVVGKLKRKRYLSAEEFEYLRTRTKRIPKITLPSPGLFVNFWTSDRSVDAYPKLDNFLADVMEILRDEVAELVRLGARYIQIDAPHYPLLLKPETRSFYESQGWSIEAWLSRGIEMDNALMAGFPEVTFGFHL